MLCTWKISDGSGILIPTNHEGPILDCAFSPDENTIISVSKDHTVKAWAYPSGALRWVGRGHTAEVTGCSVSHNNQYCITCSRDQTARRWDVATGVCLDTYHLEAGVVRGTLSSDDHYLLTTSDRRGHLIIDFRQGRHSILTPDPYFGSEGFDCLFSSDDHWAFASNLDGIICWNFQQFSTNPSAQLQHAFYSSDLDTINSFDFFVPTRRLVLALNENLIVLRLYSTEES